MGTHGCARAGLGGHGRCWLLAVLVAGCAPGRPSRIEAPGAAAEAPGGATAAELLREGDAAWARRAAPGQAAVAQARYLAAARVDRRSVAGLVGAMRAMTYRLERGQVAGLAREAVQVGRWCQLRAPEEPACRYWLAVAIGHLVREQPDGGREGIGEMTALLQEVVQQAPALEDGGAHRLLALVLLRGPDWPLGPGDPAAGLDAARAAAGSFPDSASNQLVLSVALASARQCEPARAAYLQAWALARAADARGDPGLIQLLADAEAGLRGCPAD